MQSLTGHSFASGDEDGGVRLWDSRKKAAAHRFSEHTDYISDFAFCEAGGAVLVVSGDGCLSVYDIKAGKVCKP